MLPSTRVTKFSAGHSTRLGMYSSHGLPPSWAAAGVTADSPSATSSSAPPKATIGDIVRENAIASEADRDWHLTRPQKSE
mmetsp:Transcript_16672/g.42782  ORF Transcript_16672/g.42782 Transcript_16672/m.42782 type:complete len:80 (+) Transcript_16672:1966-2205(+)